MAQPNLPASGSAVLKAITDAGRPLTNHELMAATQMARRSVFAGLTHLRKAGILSRKQSLKDGRQTYNWVTTLGPYKMGEYHANLG